MHTNYTNKREEKLIYPELSYILTGVCFEVHNKLGRFAREKQYKDLLEKRLKEIKIPYEREFKIEKTGNTVDFLIDNKIIVEIKSSSYTTRVDEKQLYYYLRNSNYEIGLLVNFSTPKLYIKRIIYTNDKKPFLQLV